ncbi:MAG: DUF3102 domain-containing protein [Clostridia bacterium]|nr:DUF3102 domain-containing protein [Clostridia bacterium]
MENQVLKQEKQELQVREISVITDEIISLKAQANNMMLMYAIEVGRRLVEAKAMLQHGEWGAWLKEKVEFSQQTANNLMNIYEEYGKNPNSKLIGNLTYTKALKLLAVPEDEREEFAQENNVDDMTVKELEKAIKERDEALKQAELAKKDAGQAEELRKALAEAEAKAQEAGKKADSIASKALRLERDLEKKKAEYEALKNNPEVSQEVIDKLKAELEAQSKKDQEAEALKNAEALKKAKEAKKKAEDEVGALKAQIEELEKKAKMSNPDVMEFKSLFDRVQKDVSLLFALNDRVNANDADMAQRLKNALKAFFEKVIGRC